MKLKDKTCKAIQPNPSSKNPIKLADGYGLFLFVMPSGSKYWRYLYRFNGKQKTYALGVYPDVGLTFVRTNELINARWDEIDFNRSQWVIPAERMKMGKEHVVPLARQAIEVLENQKTLSAQWPLVFPSNVKPQKSISNNTILGALKRLGYQGRMTGHGFRALAMSAIKQELGYRHEVVDRQLAHTPKNKIDKAYDRALFLEDRTKMMQEWADYLDGLKNAEKGTAKIK